MFEQGPDDPDAADAALSLSKAVAGITGLRLYPKRWSRCSPFSCPGFSEVAWPLIGSAIVRQDPRQSFLFKSMLSEPRWRKHGESTAPILEPPGGDTLFAWCHAHPDRAPAFAARTVPILGVNDDSDSGLSCTSGHDSIDRGVWGPCKNVIDSGIRSMRAKVWIGNGGKSVGTVPAADEAASCPLEPDCTALGERPPCAG